MSEATLKRAFIVLGSAIFAAAEILIIYIVQSYIKDIAVTGQWQMIFFIIIVFIGSLSKLCFKYFSALISAESALSIKSDLIKNFLFADYAEMIKTKNEDFISIFNYDCRQIQEAQEYHLSICIHQGMLFVFAFVYLIINNPLLLLISFTTVVLLIYFINITQKPLKKLTQKFYDNDMAFVSAFNNAKINIYNIKSLNLEQRFLGDFSELVEAQNQNCKKMNFSQGLAFALSQVVEFIPIFVSFTGGLLFVQLKLTTYDGFIIFLYILQYLLKPIETVPLALKYRIFVKNSSERIRKLLSVKKERQVNKYNDTSFEKPLIVFENINFSYEGAEKLLNNMNVQLSPNEKILLKGKNGAGKSTIFKLICGFLKPDDGTVTVFNNPVHDCDLNRLRQAIAYVSQEAMIFPDSIKNNITFSDENYSAEELVDACELCCIHDEIMNMSKQYETILDENGTNLSGGQKQRLNLARAIYRKAKILLLDEPFSQIDIDTQNRIIENICRTKTAIILITHRETVPAGFSRKLTLKDGKFIEETLNTNSIEILR